MSVTVPIDAERLLRAEESRTGVPAEELVRRAVQAQFGTAVNRLDAQELLMRIQEPLDEGFWTRFRELAARRTAESLTEVERGELIALVRQANVWNNRRLEAGIALAKLRGVPYEVVQQELRIEPVSVE